VPTRTATLDTTTTSSTPTSPIPPTSVFARVLPASFQNYLGRLRREHQSATQRLALDRIRAEGENGHVTTWRLGESGLREREEAEERLRQFEARRRAEQLLGREEDEDGGDENIWNAEDRPIGSSSSGLMEPRAVGRRTHPEPPWSQERSSGFGWWGPIRRWRLQDRTVYD